MHVGQTPFPSVTNRFAMPHILQLAFGSALKQLGQIISPSSSVLLRFRQRLHSTMGRILIFPLLTSVPPWIALFS